MAGKNAFNHPLQIADGEAVIRHRHMLRFGSTQPHQQMTASDDAAAALNEYGVRCQIVGEVFSDGDFNLQVFARFLT